MKYLLMILIVFIFGSAGFLIKQKIKNQKELIDEIKNYIIFYQNNLLVYQNNLFDINSRYIIMQKNKNANYSKFILKNNNLFEFDDNFLKSQLSSLDECELIIDYFKIIGKFSYEIENEKSTKMIKVLTNVSDRLDIEIEKKGDLWFKLLLSIGLVISILIW